MPSKLDTAGWALLGLFTVTSAWIGNLESSPLAVRVFQVAYLVGFVGYGLIIRRLFSRRVRLPAQAGADDSRWWIAVAIVMRLALAATTPSDDLYRYLWEGRIQLAGHNPYVLAPDSPQLVGLRDAEWQRVSHPEYTAIYGPLAQLEFRIVADVRPTIGAFKLVHLLVDCLTVVLLALWCRSAGLGAGFAKLYGLCPLVLTATAIGGHVDSLMLALLAGAGLLISRAGVPPQAGAAVRRQTAALTSAALLLGAAAAVKPVVIVLWPWLFFRRPRWGVVAVIGALLLYLPYGDAGLAVFDSLIRFSGQTAFFGLSHSALSVLIGQTASRCVSVAAVGTVIAVLLHRRAAFETYAGVVFGATVLLMPVVHYWYLTWVILFLPFRTPAPTCAGTRTPWLVLAASMVCYFEASAARAATGIWSAPDWAFYATYLPFLAAWGATVAARRWRKPARPAGPRDESIARPR